MAVRLNKVLREFNVGLQTVVDYLEKKGYKIDADLNAKLSDDEYQIVKNEFGTDKDLKKEVEKIITQRLEEKVKEKKVVAAPHQKEQVIKAEVPQDAKPQVKKLGQIDLEKLAPKKPKAEQPKVEAPAVKETPKVEAEPKKEPVKAEPAPAPKAEPKEEKAQPEVKTVTPEKEQSAEEKKVPDEVFRPHTQPTISGPKVLGSIDLSAINESTHPQKKTKEEKRKEREEKFHQNEIRKKRNRIQGNKVDISSEVKKDNETEKENKGNNNSNSQNQNNQQRANKKNKKQKNQPVRQMVSDEDVAKEVKKTLARLTNKQKAFGSGVKHRREKRDLIRATMEERMNAEESQNKILKITEFVTANELASMMDVPVTQIIGTCMSIGMMVSINQRLDAETINLVAEEYGFKTEYVSASVSEAVHEEEDNEDDLEPRDAIVTVMGHVDHGKTSLLDYIRKTSVIAGEAGGITQHIGAYNVTLENGRHITFLDTPGHEAFTAMRARGAQVTDIAIIIIAADDGVMPQTKEAITHAQAAGVPIVFAINKIDKPGANPEKIKEQLSNMNILVEEWGGKYQSQDISAKKGDGVFELLEKVLLEADMLDLKANPKRKAKGSIIESSLDKGRGYVATVLVSDGTLHIGDIVLAGTSHGRVKAMFNERNQKIKEALPGEPALILGLNGAPQAGDDFNVMATEQEAREIANKREQLQREFSIRTKKHVGLEEIGRRLAIGDFKELNIIVKGDVVGSVEALSDSLIKLSTENIQVNVIHKAVGAISDSDILLAEASDAIIIGFQVRPTATAKKMAEKEEIDIRLYSIIYDAIEEVKAAMEGMLAPEIKEQVTATLEVLQTFRISKVGTIAGCIVRDGKIKRSNKVRVIHDGIVVYTGELASLKRQKDDVKEVGTNTECGLNIKSYNDINEGDIIEAFDTVEIKKEL
ncbi:MAG TPA: translation initiation factor IF-2 [Prevotellaceae bacterium]|nr:translation initiation factor IF-2 [Prevotellaceae bacterium]